MYSKKLNQNFYKQDDGSVIFDDKVVYTQSEMLKLHELSFEMIQAVHEVKKIFCGEVIR